LQRVAGTVEVKLLQPETQRRVAEQQIFEWAAQHLQTELQSPEVVAEVAGHMLVVVQAVV
jgi:hypothetical protein